MIPFFGTAAACGAVAVVTATGSQAQSPIRAVGAAAYLAGWASTMLVNGPLNNRLSGNGSGQTDLHWHIYERAWSRANHVRAVLSFVGAAGLLIPVQGPGPLNV
ncbi:DUF1772 domain-containing protein [Arthrobacter sp. B6]|uniref:anthrone oxygenase family protein n=1 Tax=Arthrobacter sp. B6 TaxID=1570137 RepID=UPI0008313934